MEMLSVVLTDKNKVSGCRDDDYCRSTLVLKSVVCTGRGSDGKCICVGAASRGSDVSVILKERQQVVVAAAGKVWRIQVRQNIV